MKRGTSPNLLPIQLGGGKRRLVNSHVMLQKEIDDRAFTSLIDFVSKVPAITGTIAKGAENNGRRWLKFEIDINHQFAWHTVQEPGHVLNYLSLDARLPTTFRPISPPPSARKKCYAPVAPDYLRRKRNNKSIDLRKFT